jgi:hypothetical protein
VKTRLPRKRNADQKRFDLKVALHNERTPESWTSTFGGFVCRNGVIIILCMMAWLCRQFAIFHGAKLMTQRLQADPDGEFIPAWTRRCCIPCESSIASGGITDRKPVRFPQGVSIFVPMRLADFFVSKAFFL